MSCIKNIRTDLAPSFPQGGTWTYVGYHATNPSGPFNGAPASPLVPVTPSVLTGWGDNFVIDTDDKTAGFYRFTYNVNGVTHTLTVSVESDLICAGVSKVIYVASSSSTPINLFSELAGTLCPSPASGGTWTNLDSASGWTAPNFTPSTAGAGTWRFKYSLFETGFDVVTCNCAHEAIITVEVAAGLEVNISTAAEPCTYTIEIQRPSVGTVNTVNLVTPTNNSSVYVEYNRVVEWCNGSQEVLKSSPSLPIGTSLITSQALGTGGYIDHFTLKTTTGGTITVPLSPSTAVLSGVGGNVSASELAFLSVSPNIFSAAIAKCIRNYLGTLSYTEGVHYSLIQVNYTSGTKLRITFACKNSPTSLWIGISTTDNEIEYLVNKAASVPVLDEDDWSPHAPALVISDNYSNAPCPSGQYQLTRQFAVNIMDALDLTTLDFNNIDLDYTFVAVTVTGTATYDCSAYELTANTTGCGGTLSYLWSTGATSQSIVVTPGYYSVEVTCSSPSATAEQDITI